MIHCTEPASTPAVRQIDPVRQRPIGRRGNEVTVTTTDGVQLAVRDYGPHDAARTVVLLHGFCLSADSWSGQINSLIRRYGQDIRVIAYDHRGHGHSGAAPMCTYQLATLAADLADVLAALAVTGQLILVGHSMGAMTALMYCGRSPAERPAEPQGLVLAATAAGRLTERGLGRLLATPATAAMFGVISHTPAQAIRMCSGPLGAALGHWRGAARAQRATLAALAAAALATTPLPTIVGFLPALSSYNAYPVLDSIRARTVILSGGADLLTPPEHAHDLAAAIPGATHVHLPNAGHMLPHEAPHAVHEAIRRAMFTTSTDRTSAADALVHTIPTPQLGRASYAR